MTKDDEADRSQVAARGVSDSDRTPSAKPDVAHVDPHAIELVYVGSDIREVIHRRGIAVDGDWDRECLPSFERTFAFRALRDFLVGGKRWEETQFFRTRVQRIVAGVPQYGCRTEEEFRARGEHLRELYERIRAEGYRSQAQQGRPASFDEVRIAIDRDGRLIFLDGRHRLSIAKLLDLDSIPVHVAQRHATWDAFREVVGRVAERRGALRQPIDHPDLARLPSEQGARRRDVVCAALRLHGFAGGTLVDLNPGWGYVAQQLASAGMSCTAVVEPAAAWYARRLERAATASYTVVDGLTAARQLGRCDVVLALDGPAWLPAGAAPEAGYGELVARLRPAVAFLEPRSVDGAPAPDELGGVESAEAFAAATGMQLVGVCGRTERREPLYMLRREPHRAPFEA